MEFRVEDPYDNTGYHETFEQAKADYDERLRLYAENAPHDGWPEEIADLAIVQVIGTTEPFNYRKAADDDPWDEIFDCRYAPCTHMEATMDDMLDRILGCIELFGFIVCICALLWGAWELWDLFINYMVECPPTGAE